MRRWLTSQEMAALTPARHDHGTGLEGDPLGVAVHGGPFVFDPLDAYRAGLVHSPNVLVTGSIGEGKSTLIKMLLDRGLARGRRAVVLDPKGEYHELAARHGGAVVALGTGRPAMASPFSGDVERDSELAATAVAAVLRRTLDDREQFVLERLWRRHGALAQVADALARHRDDDAPSAERTLALVLRRLVDGDLRGLFDGVGEIRGAPLTVLDLSEAWSSEHLALVGLAATALARRHLAAGGYLVVDEAWAVLIDPRVARWLQGSWKLARSAGISHVVVLHRWSDAFAAADEGTAQRERVLSILRDCDSQFHLRQDPSERATLTTVARCSDRELAALMALPRGVVLARFGPHRSVVRLRPRADELDVIDTDAFMRASA
jgi:hypothetical protein